MFQFRWWEKKKSEWNSKRKLEIYILQISESDNILNYKIVIVMIKWTLNMK